ncbi:MAG: hypothetical protein WBN07_13315 [Woeseiaceae bacterium]
MKKKTWIALLLVASQLVFQTEASARRIILDTVTDNGTSATGCRKRKTSSFLTVPSKSYHSMGIDSLHWIVRNGRIGGIHQGDNYGWVVVGESQLVESDSVTILPSYKGAQVHMETEYWAFFCGTAGGQLREINARRRASDEC